MNVVHIDGACERCAGVDASALLAICAVVFERESSADAFARELLQSMQKPREPLQ